MAGATGYSFVRSFQREPGGAMIEGFDEKREGVVARLARLTGKLVLMRVVAHVTAFARQLGTSELLYSEATGACHRGVAALARGRRVFSGEGKLGCAMVKGVIKAPRIGAVAGSADRGASVRYELVPMRIVCKVA